MLLTIVVLLPFVRALALRRNPERATGRSPAWVSPYARHFVLSVGLISVPIIRRPHLAMRNDVSLDQLPGNPFPFGRCEGIHLCQIMLTTFPRPNAACSRHGISASVWKGYFALFPVARNRVLAYSPRSNCSSSTSSLDVGRCRCISHRVLGTMARHLRRGKVFSLFHDGLDGAGCCRDCPCL